MYQMGIDTGGTFTDFIIVDEESWRIQAYKVPSTPDDPAQAVANGIVTAEKELGIAPSKIGRIVYGTTVGTNAVLEHRGAKTGLLTTKGFRDVLEIRRQWRPKLFDLYYVKPEPLVPRYLRLEVGERVDAKGRVLEPINLEEVRGHIKKMVGEDVETIAVMFLFSFLNPSHEKRVEELIEKEFPRIYVSISSKICPEFREYERCATTVLNAYLMPITRDYLKNLEKRLNNVGITNPLRIMQSNGGLMRAKDIEETPINTLLSGPVGGVVGGVKIANALDIKNIITIDMGGTSTDISLVQNGNLELITEAEIAYNPVKVPQVNINTIGAGGGSIISLLGKGMKVGPQSAGAKPGPVCYGRGGDKPTTTDAALQLGYIDSKYFLGGKMELDYETSRAIFQEKIAKPLNMTVEEASYAALLVQASNIESGIRAVSLEKGHDPRDFSLVAFGGASGLLVAMVADQISFEKIVIPKHTSVFSAFGLLHADVKRTRSLTRIIPMKDIELTEFVSLFNKLEDEIRQLMSAEGEKIENMIIRRSCDMRYIGQAYEVNVPFPENSDSITSHTITELCNLFHVYHRRTFGHSAEEEPIELVCSRVEGVILSKEIKLPLRKESNKAPLKGQRKVYFGKEGSFIDCPIYERENMNRGYQLNGPAIIEDPGTSIVVYPGFRVVTDLMDNIIMEKES